MEECIKKYLGHITSELGKGIETMDVDSIKKATKLIMRSERLGGRLHVTGIGKPGHVAGYIASLLSSTGTCAYELDGTEAVHGSSGQVKAGDVVIAISNSGETMELQSTVQTLLCNGAHLIACTGNLYSTLAKSAEVCLLAHVDEEGDRLNKPPRASVLAEILILQCLSIALQEEKGLNLKQYVKWHPGGSLGECIRKMQK